MWKMRRIGMNAQDIIHIEFTHQLHRLKIIDQQYQITFSKDLQHLITSRRNYKGKIRGVADCGKTTVMAQRAVSAFKQTGKRVLILTYNITLCNYIYDRISDVWPREYGGCKNMRANIIVIHYHLFSTIYMMKVYGDISGIKSRNEYDEIMLNATLLGEKFDTIYVDEVHDFKKEWINAIHHMLSPSGELVFFADERQNIYTRTTISEEGKNVRMYTGVPGAWNTMKSISNRNDSDVLDMANEFQRRYLSNKYELNSISHKQGNLFHQKGKIYFHVMSSYGLLKIMDIYDEISRNYAIHDSDIVFLSNRIDILQEIDKILRDRGWQRNSKFIYNS